MKIGLLHLEQGRHDEAIREFNILLASNPKNNAVRLYLALALKSKGDIKRAIDEFLKIDPKSDEFQTAIKSLTLLYMKSGLIDEGIKKLSELADIIKDNIDINMMLATLYEEKDDYKRGIDVLEKALTNNPKNVELLYQTGVLYEKIGDTERALKYMEDVLEVDPEHANALNFIGYSWADKEVNLDKAEEMIKKALEKKPDDGYIIDSLGWVYFKRGEYEKALIEIDKAYQKLPNDPTIAEHLGDVYAILKNYAKAKEHYERSITLEKDNEKKKIIKKKLMELEERHK